MVGLDTNAMLGNRLPSEPLEALGASSFTIDPFIVVIHGQKPAFLNYHISPTFQELLVTKLRVTQGAIDLVSTQHRGEGGCQNACIVHKLM